MCLILFLLLDPQKRKTSFLHVWTLYFNKWVNESVNNQSIVFFLSD